MSKHALIDKLTKLIIDCERNLTTSESNRKHKVIETAKWMRQAIIDHGLYQRWTEYEITDHINKLSYQKLISPLKILWNMQTTGEQKRGSAEASNNKGFSGKMNEKGKWTGDAAMAKYYINFWHARGRLPLSGEPDCGRGTEDRLYKLLLKYRKQLTHAANNQAYMNELNRRITRLLKNNKEG